MEYEYNYPKETSSNSDDKDELSDDSSDSTWSPDDSYKEPSVTITVDPNEETDTFIKSVQVDKTQNVKRIVVYIISANGDRVRQCSHFIEFNPVQYSLIHGKLFLFRVIKKLFQL